jgi:hypothetical protein
MLPKLLIASLPRSGNHLTRFIVEYVTGRETNGVHYNPKDKSLSRSHFPLQVDILAHVLAPPIAGKVHFAEELLIELQRGTYEKVIVVHRNEMESILSHLVKSNEHEQWKRTRGWQKIKAGIKLAKEFWSYTAKCRKFYWHIQHLDLPVTFFSYENLISDQPESELCKLQSILGSDVDEDRMRYLVANFGKFCAISASRIGGDWGGVNSSFAVNYYARKVPFIFRLLIALISLHLRSIKNAAIQSKLGPP